MRRKWVLPLSGIIDVWNHRIDERRAVRCGIGCAPRGQWMLIFKPLSMKREREVPALPFPLLLVN